DGRRARDRQADRRGASWDGVGRFRARGGEPVHPPAARRRGGGVRPPGVGGGAMTEGGTVLVVDDNPGCLRFARAILEDAFRVHTVENGAEALAFLERRAPFADAPRPAFVVLDFHLPDMNAPAVLARLSTDATLRALPVLVLSQADWEEDERAARDAG